MHTANSYSPNLISGFSRDTCFADHSGYETMQANSGA